MNGIVGALVVLTVMTVHLLSSAVSAQPPTTPSQTQQSGTPTQQQQTTPITQTERPAGSLIAPVFPTAQGPILLTPFTHVGPYLLNPPPPQGPLTVTPSLTISEEFNDNVFSDNTIKEWDFVTGFTPGIAITLRQPTYSLSAAYNFTAEIYARHSDLNNAANRQNLALNATYQVSPRLGLTLVEYFTYDRNTNASSVNQVSTGRRASWSNTISPGLNYQITPLTTGRLYGAYTLQRFDKTTDERDALDVGGAHDSNTYSVGVAVDRTFTPRLTGTVSYDFVYFDIEAEPNSMTHTPRLGATYQITSTLTASLSAGPSILVQEGDTSVTPAVTATISQRFKYGSVSASYDRSITTGGGFGGPTDTQTIYALFELTSLMKGFVVSLSPRYAEIRTEGDRTHSRNNLNTFTLSLNAAYQIARAVSLVGSYTFFRQRSERSSTSATDVDQNRVFLGVQVAYPFGFDLPGARP